MEVITNLMLYGVISLFLGSVLLNIRYLILLPITIPKKTRWVALVWIVLLAGLGQWTGRSSTVTGISSVDSSAYVQIASILFGCLIILIYGSRNFQFSNFKFPFFGLFLFGLVGLLTFPISNVPALSLFKSTSVLVAVILAVMTIRPLGEFKRPDLLFNIVYIYVYILFSNIIVIIS